MSAENFRLCGLTAPVFTPMDGAGQLLPSRIPSYLDHLVRSGVANIFINGTSGEFFSLTLSERQLLAEAWTEAARTHPQLRTVVHIGAGCLADSRQLAEHAQTIGADAIALVPPAYMPPATVSALVDYVRTVAEAAPSLPLFYYHIPMFSKCPVDVVQFLREAAAQIPTLVGLKFTDPDKVVMSRCAEVAEGKFQVVCGMDTSYLTGLEQGQQAAILTTINFLPNVFRRLHTAYTSGGSDDVMGSEMLRVGRVFDTAVRFAENGLIAAFKEMACHAGLDVGPPRLPLKRLETGPSEKMVRHLRKMGFFEWK